jgi:hypothetical protein
MVDLRISGGRKSRSGLPKALVLHKTVCSLDVPQFRHVVFSFPSIVIGEPSSVKHPGARPIWQAEATG